MRIVVNSRKVYVLLTSMLLSAFYIFDTNVYVSYILFAGIIVISIVAFGFFKENVSFSFRKYHKNISLFIIFSFFSLLWTIDISLTIEKIVTLVELFICISVLYMIFSSYDSTDDLYSCIMYSGFLISLYSVYYFTPSRIFNLLINGLRPTRSYANINQIAMILSVSLIIFTYKLLSKKFKLIQSIFFSIISLLSLIIICTTGSRKGLITAILGCFLVIMIKSYNKKIQKTIVVWLVLLIVAILILIELSQLSVFNGIIGRMNGLISAFLGNGEIDQSTIVRQEYIQLGLSFFKQKPIFGFGLGTSNELVYSVYGADEYFHNNYVELLASGGIIGFLLYYYIWICPLASLLFKPSGNGKIDAFGAILIVLLLVMDYGMVSYFTKSTFFFLMVFYIQTERVRYD